MTVGARIVKEFVASLVDVPLSVQRTHVSRNVWKVKGEMEVGAVRALLYVKGRAEPPLRWGVTAAVVERLGDQSIPWLLILLHDRRDSGYVLTASEVKEYIDRSAWPLAGDGDYKPAAGRYLASSKHFETMPEFLRFLARECRSDDG